MEWTIKVVDGQGNIVGIVPVGGAHALDTPNGIERGREMEQVMLNTPKRPRGFASMPPNRRSEVARMGGLTAHANGNAHEWTPEEARDAGRKGGLARRKQQR